MKLWVDDVRPAPHGFYHAYSVNQAINMIEVFQFYFDNKFDENCPFTESIELISLDHDAGDYVNQGGDYIKILDWLEETERNYPIHLHSMNPVGVGNMRRIIKRNGWKEVR